MPRNMSFMMTTQQVRDETKDVTRRLGWWFLNPGDIVNGVEKRRGLKKGEKVKRIRQIRIVSTRPEPLYEITEAEIRREGFPGMSRYEFMRLFCEGNKGCTPSTIVNRIEFEYA